MFAFYLAASGTPVAAYVGLVVALAVVAALGAWTSPRGKRLLVGLLVAGMVAGSASTALAVKILCPAEWKWLGIC